MSKHAVLSWLAAITPLLAMGANQKTRLRITSACATEPMWIGHMAAASPGPDPQNVKLEPMQSHDMTVNNNLASTRYWPKFSCDDQGNKCKIGGSGGPGETCDPTNGCAPAVDTKFEATFGDDTLSCNETYKGCDYIDVSLVDGFTVPFKLQIHGDCSMGLSSDSKKLRTPAPTSIDCSTITTASCPTSEDLGAAGTASLLVKEPDTGAVAGCYAPCSKLTFEQWNNTFAANHTVNDATCKDYCCPTPPESPEACRAGPVKDTKYVKAVHSMCPGVYGYSYDDGVGLMHCPAGTQYEMIFYCPTNSIVTVVV